MRESYRAESIKTAFWFLFMFFVILLMILIIKDGEYRRSKVVKELNSVVITKEDLLLAKPGDILELSDNRMARVNMVLFGYYKEKDGRIAIAVQPFYCGSRRWDVRPEEVKRIFHRKDEDWNTAAEKFILQDLPNPQVVNP